MLRIVKPKTKRAKRELEKRAPKLEENGKKLLLLHGTKTTANVKQVLSDFYHLRKEGGRAVKYTKKNDAIRPFEGGGETSLEFLSQKTDCSLFAFGSHSKKRPSNLVLGRMFDHKVYDMIEVGIENFRSIEALGGGRKAAPQAGSKPCFAFVGEKFESDPIFRHFKDLIVDFMRGEVVETINLQGLDKVFICVAAGDRVVFKHCAIRFKKSGTRVPRVELIEAGPCMDMVLRRNREPSADLRKEAMRIAPKSSKKKVKNVSTDSLAGKVGRMYVPSQDVSDMALTKMKGLKRERREAAAAKAESKQDQSESQPGGSSADVTMGEAEGSPTKKLKKSNGAESLKLMTNHVFVVPLEAGAPKHVELKLEATPDSLEGTRPTLAVSSVVFGSGSDNISIPLSSPISLHCRAPPTHCPCAALPGGRCGRENARRVEYVVVEVTETACNPILSLTTSAQSLCLNLLQPEHGRPWQRASGRSAEAGAAGAGVGDVGGAAGGGAS